MAAKETTRYTDFNRPHALVDNRIRSQFNANFPFNKVGVLPLVSYFYPACIKNIDSGLTAAETQVL